MMSEVRWTKEQLAAIEAPVSDILVAAAAGAGKTQVLTGRIIKRLVEDGVDISRLLVVTFTKAAAAEMRQRIGKAIAAKIEEQPHNRHLRKQMIGLGAAKIATIHSFCFDIIRENFYRLGLDAAFRVADETESELLKFEMLDETLEELYAEEGDFLRLADCYASSRSDDALAGMILEVHRFMESIPNPKEWLEAQKEKFERGADFNAHPFVAPVLKVAGQKLQNALDILTRARAFSAENPSLFPYVKMFDEDIAVVSGILSRASDWDGLYDALNDFSLSRRPQIRDADPELKEIAAQMREDAKEAVNSISSLVPCPAAEAEETLKYLSPIFKSFCDAVMRFSEKYAEAKRERRLIDFSDIEHMCLHLLEEDGAPTPLALELRERFVEIYVDEYQDTNKVQERIFSIISGRDSGRPNMFMVGDIKQSIYRFRHTSPELFKEKLQSYGKSEGQRKLRLSLNFRSRGEVLDSVNHIFSQIMSADAGEIDYSEEEALYRGAEYSEAERKSEIHFIDMSEKDDENLKSVEAEAAFVAKRIRELMEDECFLIYDKALGRERRLKYSDIAVLMRSTKNRAAETEAVLSAAGIPVYSDTDSGYFDTVEVGVFLSLLSIIDNPLQDIPLIAVLRSPIFNFSEAALYEIRKKWGGKYFYTALCKAAEEGDENCAEFLKKLNRWRRMASTSPVDKLIWRLFGETGYYAFVGALPGGEGRKANLRLLFDRARRFEETSFRGLFNFIEFIERMKKGSADFGRARMLTENQNVVRIMSIHKSKGLEFPVVFLIGCGSRFNLRDTSGRLIMHPDLGLELDCVRPEERIVHPGPFKGLVAERLRRESVSEEMRVLYVGLTRAREKLIVSGAVRNLREKMAKWAALHGGERNVHYVLSAGSFIAWFGMCLMNNPGGWQVFTHSASGVSDLPQISEINIKPQTPGEEIKKRLSFAYPYGALSKVPAKLSVTELKRLMEESDENAHPMYRETRLKKPAFLEGAALSGAQRGSALHFVMQHIALDKTQTSADVKEEIKRMAAAGLISEEEAAAVDPVRIWRFFDSELGRRLKNAGRIFRETPFTMALPASVLTDDPTHSGETVVLQGTIDCWFFEGDDIVLIDYKTDTYDDPGEIARKYRRQIDFYAAALEKKYFRKVWEKYIYLFHKSDIIKL